MACIIKSPSSKFKGVITITNLEFLKIKLNLNSISELKKKLDTFVSPKLL